MSKKEGGMKIMRQASALKAPALPSGRYFQAHVEQRYRSIRSLREKPGAAHPDFRPMEANANHS
jgi:hypothetical protein